MKTESAEVSFIISSFFALFKLWLKIFLILFLAFGGIFLVQFQMWMILKKTIRKSRNKHTNGPKMCVEKYPHIRFLIICKKKKKNTNLMFYVWGPKNVCIFIQSDQKRRYFKKKINYLYAFFYFIIIYLSPTQHTFSLLLLLSCKTHKKKQFCARCKSWRNISYKKYY